MGHVESQPCARQDASAAVSIPRGLPSAAPLDGRLSGAAHLFRRLSGRDASIAWFQPRVRRSFTPRCSKATPSPSRWALACPMSSVRSKRTRASRTGPANCSRKSVRINPMPTRGQRRSFQLSVRISPPHGLSLVPKRARTWIPHSPSFSGAAASPLAPGSRHSPHRRGRLAKDVPLANRVRSGRKQP